MSWMLAVSAVLIEISLVFSLYRQIQMLQQNSYFPSRYSKWVFDSYSTEATLLSLGFCLYSFLWMFKADIFCLAVAAVLLAVRVISAVRTVKGSIKRLDFTARVKRFTALCVFLICLLTALSLIFDGTVAGRYIFVLATLSGFLSPLFTLFVRMLTAPVERLISRGYTEDAKRRLRDASRLKVIGITGSFGKTTTKFILTRILSEKYNVLCTPKSFNTPMGVVRTVRQELKPSDEIFVCEMGAKKKGDIKEICDIVRPDIGIITSVGAQHLETFGSIDSVFSTKFELAGAVSHKGGSTFVFDGCEEISRRRDKADSSIVPVGNDSEYTVRNIKRGSFGASFELCLKGTVIPVSTKLLGLNSINDILLASAVAYELGVTPEDIRVAVASLKPYEHRLELKTSVGGSLMVDDAYNSNPVGCLEAVRTLSTFEGMKKVIITPGLVELGEKEYEANYALGLEAAKFCDIIILVGKNRSVPLREGALSTGFDAERLFVVASFAQAMEVYSGVADSNTVVLLENDLPDNYLN